jgi:hypothetical protein
VNPQDAAPAARWAARRVRLDDPWDLARLLEELRAADAVDASDTARTLAGRAADAGMFHLLEDQADYPFGREPDGSPAPPWRWAAPREPRSARSRPSRAVS